MIMIILIILMLMIMMIMMKNKVWADQWWAEGSQLVRQRETQSWNDDDHTDDDSHADDDDDDADDDDADDDSDDDPDDNRNPQRTDIFWVNCQSYFYQFVLPVIQRTYFLW